MKIRVLHVIDHLGYGGAPFVVKNIVERVPADHIESTVCALRANPRSIPIDAPTVNLHCRKYNPAAFRAIARLAKERQIDIIHAHLQKAVISSLLATSLCPSKLIIHEHGPIFRRGTGCLYRRLLWLLAPRADAIVANSHATGSAIRKALGGREVPVTVVYNFIDLDRFDPARYDRGAARQSLGIGADEFVVGFVGRLDCAKGPDLLVDAAAILRDNDFPCRFFLVGDGPERKHLEQRIRERSLDRRVVLAGLHEDPAAVMPAFDAAVVPSRREAFGIAALELMRMKVPVIVSPVGGLPELIRQGQTGIVLGRLDPEEIAAAVQRLARDGGLREKLAQSAFEFAGSLDGAAQVEQIVKLYEGLM
jgi:glycosyltransferase involved in cell wall biosynthesis